MIRGDRNRLFTLRVLRLGGGGGGGAGCGGGRVEPEDLLRARRRSRRTILET